jgi:hypothetical protein
MACRRRADPSQRDRNNSRSLDLVADMDAAPAFEVEERLEAASLLTARRASALTRADLQRSVKPVSIAQCPTAEK